MVTVDEVRGQEDGNDEGEEQCCGDDGLAHVITYSLCVKRRLWCFFFFFFEEHCDCETI